MYLFFIVYTKNTCLVTWNVATSLSLSPYSAKSLHFFPSSFQRDDQNAAQFFISLSLTPVFCSQVSKHLARQVYSEREGPHHI
ncbi:hypothetical protein L1987_12330 [Smallanthus sonchifolius]|uniref:Uncharacterized protein n=1 Tax=Smallanthus sonchifolius TaxID=185202 RepID=A0ACB9JFS3_9ASTR|nr:hypothetical protein L1987_12330 [Smallanthus sonchifolius]